MYITKKIVAHGSGWAVCLDSAVIEGLGVGLGDLVEIRILKYDADMDHDYPM